MPEDKEAGRRRGLERLLDDEGLDPTSLDELSELLAQRKFDARRRWSDPEHVRRLRTTCADLLRRVEFEVGDIVRWKPALRNKNFPADDVPCVVVEVLEEPVISPEESAGSTYFREPLDLVLGLYIEGDTGGEDRIRMFHFDGRRFELHPDFQDHPDSSGEAS